MLVEIDDTTKQPTGRQIETRVSYVMKTKDCTFWSEEEINKYGFQIIQFDKVDGI